MVILSTVEKYRVEFNKGAARDHFHFLFFFFYCLHVGGGNLNIERSKQAAENGEHGEATKAACRRQGPFMKTSKDVKRTELLMILLTHLHSEFELLPSGRSYRPVVFKVRPPGGSAAKKREERPWDIGLIISGILNMKKFGNHCYRLSMEISAGNPLSQRVHLFSIFMFGLYSIICSIDTATWFWKALATDIGIFLRLSCQRLNLLATWEQQKLFRLFTHPAVTEQHHLFVCPHGQ